MITDISYDPSSYEARFEINSISPSDYNKNDFPQHIYPLSSSFLWIEKGWIENIFVPKEERKKLEEFYKKKNPNSVNHYTYEQCENWSNEIHQEFGLCNIYVPHDDCDHRYYLKKGTKREQKIRNYYKQNSQELSAVSMGGCTVCYALKRDDATTGDRRAIHSLITIIGNRHKLKETSFFEISRMFYRWLYK